MFRCTGLLDVQWQDSVDGGQEINAQYRPAKRTMPQACIPRVLYTGNDL
jgi:hypothetical protein